MLAEERLARIMKLLSQQRTATVQIGRAHV